MGFTQEQTNFWVGIGQAISVWADIEWELAKLYSFCVTPDHIDKALKVYALEDIAQAVGDFRAILGEIKAFISPLSQQRRDAHHEQLFGKHKVKSPPSSRG